MKSKTKAKPNHILHTLLFTLYLITNFTITESSVEINNIAQQNTHKNSQQQYLRSAEKNFKNNQNNGAPSTKTFLYSFGNDFPSGKILDVH